MGDRSKDMEHQFAGGRGRVNAFLEADQVDVVCLEVLDRFEQFLEGAPKAVEADDTETVAGAGMVDQRAQSWTLELSSRDHVDEDADGAVNGTQIVSLPVSILWEVSKRQTAFWRRAMASKRLLLNACGARIRT